MKRNTTWKTVAGVALGASLIAGAATLSAAPSGDADATAKTEKATARMSCPMMGGMMGGAKGMSCCAPKSGASQPVEATQEKNLQRATVTIENGYKPETINAQAGKPLQLTFVSKGSSCANAVSIPALKQTFTLESGQKKTISFTPQKGTTAFACSMGMYRGKVVAK